MSNEPKLCGYCFLHHVKDGKCSTCGKSAPNTATVSLPVGSWLAGRYCVGYLLGSPGGFGIAYRCWEHDLRRPVVIKELFPGDLVTRYPNNTQVQVLNEDARQNFALQRNLFIEEARKLAQLEEVDSVVRVLSYFQENNTAYFVMPFVEGEPLSSRISPQQRLSAQDALSLIWPLAQGLEGVHRQGLLHRDIKPENVLIKKNGQPVLIDFGNATSTATLADPRAGGFHAFSPHFSAPEQQANDRNRMGPWTDVYALCGLLYYIVSGQRPVDARERIAGNTLVPLRRLVTDTQLVPDLFIEVIERGLSLDEACRPAKIVTLLEGLAPLRPAPFHWIEALPESAFGIRMRNIHAAIHSGRVLPVQWNLWAGLFQWFWFFAHRLPAPAAGIAALLLLTAALGFVTQALPVFLGIGLLISGTLSAAFADALLYRRVANVGASLRVSDPAHAKNLLAKAGYPYPKAMLIGLTVPVCLIGLGFLREIYEKNVREQITRAIASTLPRQQLFIEYWERNGAPPPSLEEMGAPFTADSEIHELSLVGGDLHMTLAIPAVAGRKLILHSQTSYGGSTHISWICESIDIPAVYVPLVCGGVN